MKQSRFTETQIVAILKETDAGIPVNEVWRKHGISSATYYKWKAKYSGLEASQLKRVRELEQEASKLKRHGRRAFVGVAVDRTPTAAPVEFIKILIVPSYEVKNNSPI